MLDELSSRCAGGSHAFELTFGESVPEYISRKGYDPQFGARPLRRVIRREIEEPLASLLLADGGRISGGKVFIDTDSMDATEKLRFNIL